MRRCYKLISGVLLLTTILIIFAGCKKSEDNLSEDVVSEAGESEVVASKIELSQFILGEDIYDKMRERLNGKYTQEEIESEFPDTLFFIDIICNGVADIDGDENVVYATKNAVAKLNELKAKSDKEIKLHATEEFEIVQVEDGTYDFDRPKGRTTGGGSFSGGSADVTLNAYLATNTNKKIGLVTFDELKEICKDSDGFGILDENSLPLHIFRY